MQRGEKDEKNYHHRSRIAEIPPLEQELLSRRCYNALSSRQGYHLRRELDPQVCSNMLAD
jgi:hypothetical protein